MYNVHIHAYWNENDVFTRELSNSLTENGKYKWKNINLVWDNKYDYLCIFCRPRDGLTYDTSNTIVFQGEPTVSREYYWNDDFKPNDKNYYRIYDINRYHWVDHHWGLERYNYRSIINTDFTSYKNKILSSFISPKTLFEGHRDRFSFVTKYLDKLDYYTNNILHDVYFGFDSIKRLKHVEKVYFKEQAILNYQYVFDAENCYEKNFFTEKIIKAILFECLCFYSGCPNIEDFIDPRCYIKIDLKKPQQAIQIIEDSIKNGEWEKRIGYIKKEKVRILNELNPLEIIHKIINRKI